MQTSNAKSLVNEYVSEVKRTATFSADSHYLVGYLQSTLEMLVRECPDAQKIIKRHIEHMLLEPSRP